MPTQPQQPTFPTDPFPIRPSTPPAAEPLPAIQTLTFIHLYGMFCLPPFPTRDGIIAYSAYAEPCMAPEYPEGFVYWRETFRLYDDEPPTSLGVRDFHTGQDLIAEMVRLDTPALAGWLIRKSLAASR